MYSKTKGLNEIGVPILIKGAKKSNFNVDRQLAKIKEQHE